MLDLTVNRFRTARGKILHNHIQNLTQRLGRPIAILDVGGRPDYWDNVGLEGISEIRMLNIDEDEVTRRPASPIFVNEIGDARNLVNYADGSVDLVHSNSVIEHVGAWPDMAAMAKEVRRVGKSGWIQTPAWEFPIEPHFRLPFVHWVGAPMRRASLRLSRDYGKLDIGTRRSHIDRINLLSYPEMKYLFPDCDIYIERFILAKSYSAHWGL